jgi:hypothetical protein
MFALAPCDPLRGLGRIRGERRGMNRRSLVLAATLALAGALPAGAQTMPVPAPSPAPVAFSAHAHANVTVTAQSNTYDVRMQMAVAQRDRFTRFDILSIRSTSVPVPSSAFTFVLDRVANTVTVWNDTAKTFYTQSVVPSLPGPTPGRSPASPFPPSARSPFADLEILSVTFALANHTTTAGLATTGLVMNADFKKKGAAATSHLTATTQLADDFAAFPVSIDAHVDPGTSAFSGRFSYLVDDFTRAVPASISFTVPAGYAQAESLVAVFLGRPVRSTSH